MSGNYVPEKDRAESLAQRLGTRIPCDISRVMWALPILEAMAERLARIEDDVREGKQRAG